ncbi:hypothetical protein RFI_19769, partial [Reticulomyxa filosa]
MAYLTINRNEKKSILQWNCAKKFVNRAYYGLTLEDVTEVRQGKKKQRETMLGMTTNCEMTIDWQRLRAFCERNEIDLSQLSLPHCPLKLKVQTITVNKKEWICSEKVLVRVRTQPIHVEGDRLHLLSNVFPLAEEKKEDMDHNLSLRRDSRLDSRFNDIDKVLCDEDVAIVFAITTTNDRNHEQKKRVEFQHCTQGSSESGYLHVASWHVEFAQILGHYFNVISGSSNQEHVSNEGQHTFCLEEDGTESKGMSRSPKRSRSQKQMNQSPVNARHTLVRVISFTKHAPSMKVHFLPMVKHLIKSLNTLFSGEQVLRAIEYLAFDYCKKDAYCLNELQDW